MKGRVIKRPFYALPPVSLMGLSLCTMRRREPEETSDGHGNTHTDGITDRPTDEARLRPGKILADDLQALGGGEDSIIHRTGRRRQQHIFTIFQGVFNLSLEII